MPEAHFSGKYKLIKLLNNGPYSKVYHARDTRTGRSVAIKAASDDHHHHNKGSLNEIQALKRLAHHHHVIKLLDYVTVPESGHVYVVTEFAKRGDLFELVADRGRLSEDLCRHYFRQLISAVKYCHSHGVFHRDIKPENLLVDEKLNLKLSDFGLCAFNTDDPTQKPDSPRLMDPCGTPEYAAPEVIAGRGYDGAEADVWSCGVVLYVLAVGYLPFDGGDVAEMWGQMRRRELRLPEWMSPGLKWLLLRVLDPNPETRITIDEILEDGWFKEGYNGEMIID